MSGADGGVTNEVLAERLAALTDEVRQMRGDICVRLKDHESRIRQAERQLTVNSQRLGLVTGGMMMLQVIGSAIATWLGIRN